MEIKSDLYLQKLIERKENDLIKIVTDIRRNGESDLLVSVYKQSLQSQGAASNHIIEIVLDGVENEELLDPGSVQIYLRMLLFINVLSVRKAVNLLLLQRKPVPNDHKKMPQFHMFGTEAFVNPAAFYFCLSAIVDVQRL
ncbi:MAG: hypothetical protein HUJ54_13335, partial [Erysipelotrichaceae bacterium]|nr:hypothetical protein [Erysipelotrichaceae bacterium]